RRRSAWCLVIPRGGRCTKSARPLQRLRLSKRNRTMPRVLVTPTILRHVPGLYSDTLLQAGFEIVYPPDDCDTMQHGHLLPLLAGADAMLASVAKLSREVLAGSRL